ncbi:hypothetical protein [Chryseobacterium echinoideorum]|uniref:hypothetical protein n=1 Tax=Chryseobacterium echinoideorum TaxID=1549648 RepID=UPI001185DA5C|nr:hypothetical protein [Chryseobacterium echinoideorum]
MDFKIKYQVINSNILTNYGIIIELDNVENGFPVEKAVLKSVHSNLFWEIEQRIIENLEEKRFDNEEIVFSHINSKNPLSSEVLKNREEKNIRLYKISPIGHKEQPKIGENLVFHSTTFRKKIRIKEIYDNYFLLEGENNYIGVIPKRKVVRNHIALVGDYVRHCEHQFHDLVDANDKFIYR